MPIPADQRDAILELLDSGAELALLCMKDGESITTVTIPVYAHPGAFGVLLAELVEQAANAYIKVGFDPTAARHEILNALGNTLDFPMARPVAVQMAMEDVPRG